MTEHDPEALADELERQADDLQEHSQRLGEEVKDVRQDWEQKRSDPSIAGANPPDSEEGQPEEASLPAKDDGADDAA